MTDELTLYNTDRAAWLAYVATNMARKIATDTDDEVRRNWPNIPRDYQTAVWQHLDDTQRQRIRGLREGK